MELDLKKTPRKQRQEARWKPGPEAVKRQARVLEELTTGASIDAATGAAGVSRSTFYKWCERDPAFKAQSDRLRNRTQSKREPISFGAEFRSKYLHRSTPDHQGQMDELIKSLGPREWGLILAPPEHLKTTETEDFLTWVISQDPNIRTLVISKTEGHAKNVLGVVKDRLTDFDTHGDLIEDFGPFQGQPWTAKRFTVAGKTSGERDATCEAMGLNGSPFGHRVDVLVLDDLIDLSNAENVDAQVEWVERIADTRLTKNGIVIVVGSRIRENDLNNAMLESGWIHKSLILPAIVREPGELGDDDPGESLWPDEWPIESLIEKRERMKDQRSWLLTYQQRRLQAADADFPRSMIESCFDSTLSTSRPRDCATVVGIDPGLRRATAGFAVHLDRTTKIRHWGDVRTVERIGEGGDTQEALINFTVGMVRDLRATTCVLEANSAFELLAGSKRLKEELKALYCSLIVVTSEGDGLKAQSKWRTDRPELSYPSMSELFANQLYKIPATGGARRLFKPAIDQFERYTPNSRSPKDILSAARLAEFGCLEVLDQHYRKSPERSYADAMERLVTAQRVQNIPAYIARPHMNRLKDKAMAQRNERLWGPDGQFTRRLPRRGANHPEQETA